MTFIFQQLGDEETLEQAVAVVIELISLSRKDKFIEIRNYVLSNVESLQSNVLLVL
jgi:hypothetical protein